MLCRIVKRCMACIRDFDIVGRIGGEEFALVMLETSVQDGKEIAERIRKSVSERPILHGEESINCTVSIGVYTSQECSEPLDRIYKNADLALYKAKSQGRNLVSS